MNEIIQSTTKSQIKTFHLIHRWTIENFKHLLDNCERGRFIDSNIQKPGNHFNYYLRLNIDGTNSYPCVELHIEALKEIKFQIEYKIALLDDKEQEIKYCTLGKTGLLFHSKQK